MAGADHATHESMEDAAPPPAETPAAAPAGDAAIVRALGPGGRYQLFSLLGRGGFGAVYRARDTVLDRVVAVKVIEDTAPGQGDAPERFRREARVLARLEHEHILPVYDFGAEANGVRYVVMRLVEGGSLRDRLLQAPGVPWPLPAALDLAAQVLDALDYAHQRGIVHRDVKPENILLRSAPAASGGEWAYLADFGLAKLLEAESAAAEAVNLTRSGTFMGTAAYMAPEQARGQLVDGRADLYAFGVVLYELLAGQAPFRGETPWEVLVQHLQTPPPPLRAANPSLPAGVEAALATALAKQPADRYATGADFLAALRAATAAPPPGPGKPGGTQTESAPAGWPGGRAGDGATGGHETGDTTGEPAVAPAVAQAGTVTPVPVAGAAGYIGAAPATSAASPASAGTPALTPEALDRARQLWELDALYARALRHLAFEEWPATLAQLERLQSRQPGYRDTEALLARTRQELAARAAAPAPRTGAAGTPADQGAPARARPSAGTDHRRLGATVGPGVGADRAGGELRLAGLGAPRTARAGRARCGHRAGRHGARRRAVRGRLAGGGTAGAVLGGLLGDLLAGRVARGRGDGAASRPRSAGAVPASPCRRHGGTHCCVGGRGRRGGLLAAELAAVRLGAPSYAQPDYA